MPFIRSSRRAASTHGRIGRHTRSISPSPTKLDTMNFAAQSTLKGAHALGQALPTRAARTLMTRLACHYALAAGFWHRLDCNRLELVQVETWILMERLTTSTGPAPAIQPPTL